MYQGGAEVVGAQRANAREYSSSPESPFPPILSLPCLVPNIYVYIIDTYILYTLPFHLISSTILFHSFLFLLSFILYYHSIRFACRTPNRYSSSLPTRRRNYVTAKSSGLFKHGKVHLFWCRGLTASS